MQNLQQEQTAHAASSGGQKDNASRQTVMEAPRLAAQGKEVEVAT